jgi:hypothetical protein
MISQGALSGTAVPGLGEYAMAEHIRAMLVNEQEHQSDRSGEGC